MTIKNGKIAEATESELFNYYLSRGFDDIMSFKCYMERCERLGTVITEKEEKMRPKKKLPEYDDIIFLDFESAKLARASLMDNLKYFKKKHPEVKHFMSVADLECDIYGTRVKHKVVEGYPADNRRYGWYKRPGIYEVENGNPSAGYIFEDPVLLA